MNYRGKVQAMRSATAWAIDIGEELTRAHNHLGDFSATASSPHDDTSDIHLTYCIRSLNKARRAVEMLRHCVDQAKRDDAKTPLTP